MASGSSIASMPRVRRVSAAGVLLGLLGLGLSSCLYDSGDRCDPGQNYHADSGVCVCAGNTVAGERGCVECGENQVAKDDVCACVEGYKLNGATCEFVPLALGKACDDDSGCTDARYSACHAPDAKPGYCTNTGCTTTDDCQGGYACNTSTTPSFCQQPPSGQGDHCASEQECSGKDASYCEVFKTKQCYVQGCAVGGDDCFAGYECCDLAALSNGIINKQICVKAGTCGQ